MNFTIKSDLKNVIPMEHRETVLKRIGKIIAGNIVKRTQFENVDVNKKAFRPYSEKYTDYKQKKGGSGNIVNLTSVESHPHMMSGIDIVNVDNNSVEVGFSDQNFIERANYNETRKGREREFMGVNEDDSKQIDDTISDYIDNELNNL